MLGEILKAMACITELTRAVTVLNVRLEAHTHALHRMAQQSEEQVAVLKSIEARLEKNGNGH